MSDLPRRSVLIGAAVAPLAACGATTANQPDTPPRAAGEPLTAAADVGVGDATIVDGTLITQPKAGVFKGFIARCTHAGCALAVKNGGIECPCHGSRFTLDGEVERGPATEALTDRPVTVKNGQILVE